MPEKIIAWETVDGKIFKHENDAIKHENRCKKIETLDKQFELLKQELKGVNLSEYSHWDCKSSPIGVCVYKVYTGTDDWGEECCYFCGQPEERK